MHLISKLRNLNLINVTLILKEVTRFTHFVQYRKSGSPAYPIITVIFETERDNIF
jgi:hypothetical protein